jgi:hypothetical protein
MCRKAGVCTLCKFNLHIEAIGSPFHCEGHTIEMDYAVWHMLWDYTLRGSQEQLTTTADGSSDQAFVMGRIRVITTSDIRARYRTGLCVHCS